MITKAVIQKLISEDSITALVDDRVEPTILKEGITYPAIYVSTSSMEPIGCSVAMGIKTGRIEIGVYSDTYEEARQVIQAIRDVLDDFSGIVSGVALRIRSGQEVPEGFDEQSNTHIKILEYEADAQIVQ